MYTLGWHIVRTVVASLLLVVQSGQIWQGKTFYRNMSESVGLPVLSFFLFFLLSFSFWKSWYFWNFSTAYYGKNYDSWPQNYEFCALVLSIQHFMILRKKKKYRKRCTCICDTTCSHVHVIIKCMSKVSCRPTYSAPTLAVWFVQVCEEEGRSLQIT